MRGQAPIVIALVTLFDLFVDGGNASYLSMAAMPDNRTGSRSGNSATRERLPPMASTYLRRVESIRSLRLSSRETQARLCGCTSVDCYAMPLERPS